MTPITYIYNWFPSEAFFPSYFKSGLVSSLLTKPTLNKDNMNSCWSVSNFSFLSEVLEDLVANCLNSHISSSNKPKHYQSAYRKFHSTETAVLEIHNHILLAMVDGTVTAFTLLDLSVMSTCRQQLPRWCNWPECGSHDITPESCTTRAQLNIGLVCDSCAPIPSGASMLLLVPWWQTVCYCFVHCKCYTFRTSWV